MLRDLLNSLNPWQRATVDVARLLKQLDSPEPGARRSADKQLNAVFYPDAFEGRPRILSAADYTTIVERHRSQLRSSPEMELLLAALGGPGHQARLYAIAALAANQEPRAFDGIVAALRDPSSEIRSRAATQLMHYRDRRAVEPLIAVLLDPEDNPRQFAANALGFIGDPEATKPLLNLLESRNWGDRSRALYALGNIGSEAALPAVRTHLRDSVKRVRKAAKAALASYDTRRRETLANRSKIG